MLFTSKRESQIFIDEVNIHKIIDQTSSKTVTRKVVIVISLTLIVLKDSVSIIFIHLSRYDDWGRSLYQSFHSFFRDLLNRFVSRWYIGYFTHQCCGPLQATIIILFISANTYEAKMQYSKSITCVMPIV